MPEDLFMRAITQAFPNVVGDPILTEQDLRSVSHEKPWDTVELWGLRIQPGATPHALVFRGRPSPPLDRAFYQSLIEGMRELARKGPHWNDHLRVHWWVVGNDLILHYSKAMNWSRYWSWKLAVPFHPRTCTLVGQLIVVGTDAKRWVIALSRRSRAESSNGF